MPRSKKVLIFGKTGDGKSTVGNMLVRGTLRPTLERRAQLPFKMGDGMEGVTNHCERASGCGYDVVDTVGLGEQTDDERKNAVQLIRNFLTTTKGPRAYDHIIFVKEAGRHNQLDEDVWRAFLDVFQGCEQHFVLVLTKATNPTQWLSQNRSQIEANYSQCEDRIVCVTFPPVDADETVDDIYEARRMESLQVLRSKLQTFYAANRGMVHPLSYADMNDQELVQRSFAIWTNIMRLSSYLNMDPRRLLRALFGRNTRYMREY